MCSQTKELQTLSSSGRYMLVRFAVGVYASSTGFLATIHYGKEIMNKTLV